MALNLALLSFALAVADPSVIHAAADVQQQFERWERRLRARIIELHVVPAAAKIDPPCDVVISFAIGRNRRPADAAIRNSSCKPFYDRAALRVVSQLGRVGRVPSMIGKDHRVLLKLSYGQAPTAVADRGLVEGLAAERQLHSRRNLEIVSRAVYPTDAAGPRGTER